MEPREIAARVLELLGPNGERWGKGLHAADQCECITTAAYMAEPLNDAAREAFYGLVLSGFGDERKFTDRVREVQRVNDRSKTTFADVRRVLTQIASEP